jgi:hypothetical protein
MKTLSYLDVIEICLVNIPEGQTTGTIKPAIIFGQMGFPISSLKKPSIGKIRMILKKVFPIYKNKRRNTKCFKIRQSEAYNFIIKNGLLLRPIEHARWSYLRREVECI